MNIIDFFDCGASLDPHRPFLIQEGRARTYRQVQDASHKIAGAMAACGLRIGSRVAVREKYWRGRDRAV